MLINRQFTAVASTAETNCLRVKSWCRTPICQFKYVKESDTAVTWFDLLPQRLGPLPIYFNSPLLGLYIIPPTNITAYYRHRTTTTTKSSHGRTFETAAGSISLGDISKSGWHFVMTIVCMSCHSLTCFAEEEAFCCCCCCCFVF